MILVFYNVSCVKLCLRWFMCVKFCQNFFSSPLSQFMNLFICILGSSSLSVITKWIVSCMLWIVSHEFDSKKSQIFWINSFMSIVLVCLSVWLISMFFDFIQSASELQWFDSNSCLCSLDPMQYSSRKPLNWFIYSLNHINIHTFRSTCFQVFEWIHT